MRIFFWSVNLDSFWKGGVDKVRRKWNNLLFYYSFSVSLGGDEGGNSVGFVFVGVLVCARRRLCRLRRVCLQGDESVSLVAWSVLRGIE